MGFEWNDDQEIDLTYKQFKNKEDQENNFVCHADNPDCQARYSKEIKLCWDIMNEVVYNGRVFVWNDKFYHLKECTKCENYYIMEDAQNNFICDECK